MKEIELIIIDKEGKFDEIDLNWFIAANSNFQIWDILIYINC